MIMSNFSFLDKHKEKHVYYVYQMVLSFKTSVTYMKSFFNFTSDVCFRVVKQLLSTRFYSGHCLMSVGNIQACKLEKLSRFVEETEMED